MTKTIVPAGLLAAVLLALAAPAGAQSFGSSFSGLQVKGDQPIAIDADQLDVDDKQRVATFSGNVEVAQGDTLMKTTKLLVFYANSQTAGAQPAKASGGAMPGGSNQIDRLEASGKVYIRSGDQVATAEQGTFDMKTQIAVLTNNVVMSQGENVARGDKLTIHMDTGVAQLGGGGRVTVLVTPDGAGPGAAAGKPRP